MTLAFLKTLLFNRAALYVVSGILAIFAAIYWYKSHIHAAEKLGEAKVTAVVAQAAAVATEKQLQSNSIAATEYAVASTAAQTKVEYRTKEVVKYVHDPKTVTCAADAEFIRLFNNTSRDTTAKAVH